MIAPNEILNKDWFPEGSNGDHRVARSSFVTAIVECTCGALFDVRADFIPVKRSRREIVNQLFIDHCVANDPVRPLDKAILSLEERIAAIENNRVPLAQSNDAYIVLDARINDIGEQLAEQSKNINRINAVLRFVTADQPRYYPKR